MKKTFLSAAVFALIFISCKENKAGESKMSNAGFDASSVTLPMQPSYVSKIEFGSSDNMVKVMQWNKWMSEHKIDSAFTTLADSVLINLADGSVYNSTKDSIKKVLNGWASAMKTINIKYVAALPVNAIDKKNEWVFSWTDESYEFTDGKKEHFIIHEDYLLANGKIRQVNQYSRVVKP